MMFVDVTMDEMFPRAVPVMRPPLPILKTEKVYAQIDQKAKSLGLKLTDAHREVIDFILDFYEVCDDCENARKLADMIQDEFAGQGGRKYLYRLFPNGPLTTIHELADLPSLGHETDKSFGTRW